MFDTFIKINGAFTDYANSEMRISFRIIYKYSEEIAKLNKTLFRSVWVFRLCARFIWEIFLQLKPRGPLSIGKSGSY